MAGLLEETELTVKDKLVADGVTTLLARVKLEVPLMPIVTF